MSKARDGYRRIVVFQPRSGWVVDIGANQMLSPRFSAGEGYFNSAAGTRRAVSRERTFEIPIIDNNVISHLRVMHQQGCEVRCIAFGWGSHLIWEMDSEINLVPFRGGPGRFAGERLVLNGDIFNGSIYQSDSLLDGIPWTCESAQIDGALYYFKGPGGFSGNRWLVSSGSAVDEVGTFNGTGTPQLTMHFPVQGAQIQISGSWSGNVKTLDHSGATLSTFTKGLLDTLSETIDDGTWKIEINVTTATGIPLITVTSPGAIVSPRDGVCVDCSNLSAVAGSAPGWSS